MRKKGQQVDQNYEIESGRREALRAYLEADGIRIIVQWNGKGVHQFTGLGLPRFDLPATERLFRGCLLPPMNTSLTDDEVETIVASIRRFHGRVA